MGDHPPKGSGCYAALMGILFLVALALSFKISVDLWTRQWLVRTWLAFVSVTLLFWGINRINTGRRDWTVGQDTINLVNALIATTIALVALLFSKG
jgi:hypothetical protein